MTPELRKAVLEVYETAQSKEVRAVLVGALMMEFTPEFKPGVFPAYKRTNDADFAVCVKNWPEFKRLRTALEEIGYDRNDKIEHRLTKGEVIVDLVPYGKDIAQKGKIVWPISEAEMSVIGFQEVCAAATNRVRAGLPAIPVISVPGFVLLKILAFLDRSSRHDEKHLNDAEHLKYWLENYASLTNEDEKGMNFVLEKGWKGIEAPYAGTAILGHEVAKLSSPDAASRVKKFLSSSTDATSPFFDALRQGGGGYVGEDDKGWVEDILARLRAFEKGFGEG